MPINQQSAFVRVVFDLPTPLAAEFDSVQKASGISKKGLLAHLVQKYVDESTKRTKK